MPDTSRLSSSSDGRTAIVRITGALDHRLLDDLRATLARARSDSEAIVLDLAGAVDVSPAAVEMMVHETLALARRGKDLQLLAPRPIVDHLLRLGLGDLVRVDRRDTAPWR